MSTQVEQKPMTVAEQIAAGMYELKVEQIGRASWKASTPIIKTVFLAGTEPVARLFEALWNAVIEDEDAATTLIQAGLAREPESEEGSQ